MINVFLLLGSNLGDRQLFLKQAITSIEQHVAGLEKTSSVYETQAWGREDEPDYLNQVVMLKTALQPHEVLKKILAVEQSLGRERNERWDARTIDIDILFYGDSIINDPDLEVPHPRLHLRRFTLEPLAEIAPGFIHPIMKKNILQLKNELTDGLIVKKL